MQIQPLILAGESKTLEFKRDASSLLPIIKTIIAFANTAGGVLLIGVTDDHRLIDVDFLSAIEEIPKFIQRHTLTSVKFEGMYRQDIPEYSPVALREVLINAFVHANYEVMGAHFLIAVYDNRIEIQNPGIFPMRLTIEEFKAGVSCVRNPVIARVFREVGLIEKWGSGYERIQKACEGLGCLQLPTWEEFSGVLRVTLYPRAPLDLVPDLVPKRDQVGIMSLTQEFRQILDQAQQPQALTEMMASFGVTHKTKFRHKYINPLLEEGLLRMTLPDKPNSRLQKYVITPEGSQRLRENKAYE